MNRRKDGIIPSTFNFQLSSFNFQFSPGSISSYANRLLTIPAILTVILLLTIPATAMDWRQGAFDADSWGSGFAPLGFGSENVKTAIPDSRPTYYFRKLFFLPSTSSPSMTQLRVAVRTGEGIVVGFHGQEAGRSAWLPAGDLDYEELSTYTDPSGVQEFDLTGILFDCDNTIGDNWRIIAVELHRQDPALPLEFDTVVSALIGGSWQEVVADGERWQWCPDAGRPETPPEHVIGLIRYPLAGLPAVTEPGGSFEIILDPETDADQSVFILQGTRNWGVLDGGSLGSVTERGRGWVFSLPADWVPDTYDLFVFGPAGSGSAGDQTVDWAYRSVAVLPAIDTSVTISHVSDSHLPYRGEYYPDNTLPLQRIWDGYFALQPDLVIHTGDGYNEGNFRDGAECWHQFVEKCPLPLLYLSGNHELGNWCGDAGSREHYWDFFGWLQLDPRQPGHWAESTRDYVIDAGPVSFVCLETWESYSSYWYDWYPSDSPTYAQIAWLRTVTQQRSGQTLVACYHHDFNGSIESEVIPYFGFDMGLSGHTHMDEEYFVGPIPLFKVGSTYQASKPQRWFHYDNGEITGGELLTAHPLDITLEPAAEQPAVHRTVIIENQDTSDIPGHKTWIPMVAGPSYTVTGTANPGVIGQWSAGDTTWICVRNDLPGRSEVSLTIESDEPDTFCNLMAFHVEHPVFRAGASSAITAVLTNECTGNMVRVYIAFEAGGLFFFWPDWSQTPTSETLFLSSGQTLELPVLEATWPDLPVYGQTVTFWGAVLDADSGALMSQVARAVMIY